MRKFLVISLVVTILVAVTIFISTSFALLWAYEEEPLIVSATATPDKGTPPLKVKFEAKASGGKCDSYEYKWSGAVTGTGDSITKTFKKAQKKPYKATVKVTCGEETDTASATVHVTSNPGDTCLEQAKSSPSEPDEVCWACCGTYCLYAMDYTLCFVPCWNICMAPFW